MRIDLLLFILITLASCSRTERYRAELVIDDEHSIPFMLERNKESYTVINASDRIGPGTLDLTQVGDSLILKHHAFQSELHFIERNDSLLGFWLDLSRDRVYRMPFRAYPSEQRYDSEYPSYSVNGRWDVTFNATTHRNKAIGEFEQNGGLVSGTFLTPTGDYRFFEGVVDGDSLRISTFDFAHAYMAEAEIRSDSLVGTFYSGYHYRAPWLGERNPSIELAALDTGNAWNASLSDSFFFWDLDGNPVNIQHPCFQDKAIVIQLFGSWCPNCYDESRVLQSLFEEYGEQGVAFVGVGFERPSDRNSALRHIARFRDGLGINYPLGYGGVSSKDTAQVRFPALDRVWSFPSLLFYDRAHRLVSVHSGFNGPGTGEHYTNEVADLRERIEALIQE